MSFAISVTEYVAWMLFKIPMFSVRRARRWPEKSWENRWPWNHIAHYSCQNDTVLVRVSAYATVRLHISWRGVTINESDYRQSIIRSIGTKPAISTFKVYSAHNCGYAMRTNGEINGTGGTEGWEKCCWLDRTAISKTSKNNRATGTTKFKSL